MKGLAQICINCKGKGEKRNIVRIAMALLVDTFVLFPLMLYMVFVEVGVSVFLLAISIVLVVGAVKPKECTVCRGSGKVYS